MKEFRDRIDAAVTAWKAKLKGEQRLREPASDLRSERAVAELESAARELEADLADVLNKAAAEAKRVTEFEAQAMNAIRAGDDWAAREALLLVRQSMEKLESLNADTLVLRAMIGECREVLGRANHPTSEPLSAPD
jgi:hypothetical protein